MASKKITMVDPMQIVNKGYKGCKSTRTVKNFATKNRSVNCCWWKPAGKSEKILLIEMSSFRDAWKEASKATSQSSSRTTSKTTKSASKSRSTASRATSRTTSRSNTRSTAKKNSRSNVRSISASARNSRSGSGARRVRRAA